MDNETDDTKVLLINLFLENSYLGVPVRQIVGQPTCWILEFLHFSEQMPFLEMCAFYCESQQVPFVTY